MSLRKIFVFSVVMMFAICISACSEVSDDPFVPSSSDGNASGPVDGTSSTGDGTSSNVGGTSSNVGGTSSNVGGTSSNGGGTSSNGGGTSSAGNITGASIYISEYIEPGQGGGNNKYLELYNPNSTPFDLNGWKLKQYYNGNPSSNDNFILPLDGHSIPGKGVLVIANAEATAYTSGWVPSAYPAPGGNLMSFTGQALGLFQGDALVDIVGQPSSTTAIADKKMIRKPTFGPSATYNESEWTITATTGIPDVSTLGSHTPGSGPSGGSSSSSAGGSSSSAGGGTSSTGGGTGSSIFISEYIEPSTGGGNNKYLELYNPNTTAFNLSGWKLKQYYNGNPSTNDNFILPLDGQSISAKGVLVIAHAEATAYTSGWVPSVYPAPGGNFMSFTGQALGLFQGDTLVDIVGQPASTTAIQNMKLVRKSGNGPSTTYSESHWNKSTYSGGSISTLGSHTP